MDTRPGTRPEEETRLTTKQLALQALADLPDDADLDDVIGHLQTVYAVQHGRADAEVGRVAPQDEAMQQMAQYLR